MLCKHSNTVIPNRKFSLWGTNYTTHAEKFREFIDGIITEKLTNAELNTLYNETQSSIKNFPDEVLLHTFGFLTSKLELSLASYVCKRFQTISTDQVLIQKVATLDSQRVARTTRVDCDKIMKTAISPDNKLIAIIREQSIRLYSMTGNFLREFKGMWLGHRSSLTFTKDSQSIIVRESGGRVYHRNVNKNDKDENKKDIVHLGAEFYSGEVIIYSNDFLILPNCEMVGNFYGFGNYYYRDAKLGIFDIKTGDPVRYFDTRDYFLYTELSHDKSKLICADRKKRIQIFDTISGKRIKTIKIGFSVYYAELTPDNKKIICSGFSNEVQIRDVATGKLSKTFTTKIKYSASGENLYIKSTA